MALALCFEWPPPTHGLARKASLAADWSGSESRRLQGKPPREWASAVGARARRPNREQALAAAWEV